MVCVCVGVCCCVAHNSRFSFHMLLSRGILRLGYFGSKSVLAPLLLVPVLGWTHYSALCLHKPSALDSWLEIIYEGLENFPQLYIGWFFYSTVNRSGTDAIFWLSFTVTVSMSSLLLVNALVLTCKKNSNSQRKHDRREDTLELESGRLSSPYLRLN